MPFGRVQCSHLRTLGSGLIHTFRRKICASVAKLYFQKAADPIDTNYKVIAQPTPPSLTIPAPDPSWTAAQIAAYRTLKGQLIGLIQAEITCVNCAGGAYEAGDTYWLQQQLAAQKRYLELEAFDLQLSLTQSARLHSAYATSGFPDFSVSVGDATQIEIGILQNGLPADAQQTLSILGVDADGLTSWPMPYRRPTLRRRVRTYFSDLLFRLISPRLFNSLVRHWLHRSLLLVPKWT
jgi:hypothetical protein